MEQTKKIIEDETNEVIRWMRTWINDLGINEKITRLEAMYFFANKSLNEIEHHLGKPIPTEAYQKLFTNTIDFITISKTNKGDT